MDAGIDMGPVANDRRIIALDDLVSDAEAMGAKLLLGGSRLKSNGYFFPPTVLAELPDDARAMSEEPFRPLLSSIQHPVLRRLLNRRIRFHSALLLMALRTLQRARND